MVMLTGADSIRDVLSEGKKTHVSDDGGAGQKLMKSSLRNSALAVAVAEKRYLLQNMKNIRRVIIKQ